MLWCGEAEKWRRCWVELDLAMVEESVCEHGCRERRRGVEDVEKVVEVEEERVRGWSRGGGIVDLGKDKKKRKVRMRGIDGNLWG